MKIHNLCIFKAGIKAMIALENYSNPQIFRNPSCQSCHQFQFQFVFGHQTMGLTTSSTKSKIKQKEKDNVVSIRDLNRLSREGQMKEAVNALHLLGKQGIRLDYNTYVRLLHRCIKVRALAEGKQIHLHMMNTGLKPDVFLGNLLVNMYAKCGGLDDSCQMFDKMPQRSVVTWTAMISGHCREGHTKQAWDLFRRMGQEGLKPNEVTFAAVLRLCAGLTSLKRGTQVQTQIIKSGFESDVFVASSLVVMYCKCKIVEGAHKVFDHMAVRDVVSWNALIAGSTQNDCREEALKLFYQMLDEGIKPNHFTVASAITACAGIAALAEGESVHAFIVKIGFQSDVFVDSALIDMYSKCGSAGDALRVFEEMPQRDVVSWNALITGYAQNGPGEEALKLFCQMQSTGIRPSQFTFGSVLKACAGLANLDEGKHVHAQVIKFGYVSDVFVGSALVDMYVKCENLDDARAVFDKMTKRNVVSCNTMISGYAQHEHGLEALKIFCQMLRVPMRPDLFSFISVLSACAIIGTPDQGNQVHAFMIKTGCVSNIFAEIALIDMYSKCGSMYDACKIFDMSDQNTISFTALIAGYIQNGHDEEALKIFCQMQTAGRKPDQFTFSSVLRACVSIAAMEQGSSIHACIIKTGFESDTYVGSALVDVYSKCGRIEDAWRVFDKMTIRSIVSWNTMITGYAQHGLGKKALQLFEQMELAGMKPTLVTFIGILSACSHVGLIDEGCYYFDSMIQHYGITPRVEHYTCMVDLLGRTGCLNEAESFISKMPFVPEAVVWRTLLGACKVHRNVEIGKRAAECCLKLEPNDSATYVLLSNIYASAGRWTDVAKVRNMMKDRGVKKEPGCSWIEVKTKVHKFVAQDKSHLQMQEIHARLGILIWQMKMAGYVSDTNSVLDDVEHKQDIIVGITVKS